MSALGVALVSEPRREQLELHLLGCLDASTVEQVLEDLGERTAPAVVIDLRQVTSFTPAGRSALVGLARALMAQSGRRAWLASTPQLRGVALWVLHVVPDPHARVVSHPAAALRWLEGSTTRVQAHEQTMAAYVALRRSR